MHQTTKHKQNLVLKGFNDSKILIKVSTTIIEHWAEKMKYELLWHVINKKIPRDKMELVLQALDELNHSEELVTFDLFTDFKNKLIQTIDLLLKNGFPGFLMMLEETTEAAWKRLAVDFLPKFLKWVQKRTVQQNHQEIFHNTLIVLLEKLKLHNLHFRNSKELKSYLFTIAEFKVKESNRTQIKQRVEIELEQQQIDNLPSVSAFDELTKDGLVNYIIENLETNEKEIIYGVFYHNEKLKDIAKRLNISEANCRVIKHRVLSNLKKEYKAHYEKLIN